MFLLKAYLIALYNRYIQRKEKDIVLKTIPIGTFSQIDEKLASFAGGFIVKYKNHNIVLTASHVIKEPRKIGILLESYKGKPNVAFYNPLPIIGMQLKQDLPPVSEIKKYSSINNLFEKMSIDYDLVYSEISDKLKILQNDVNSPFWDEPRRTINITFPIQVNKKQKYKFYGLSYIPNKDNLPVFNQIYRNDLKLVYEDSYFLYFKTRKKFKKTIYGCSGAPVFNKKNELISMIIAQKDNYIKALKLNILEAILFASYDCEV